MVAFLGVHVPLIVLLVYVAWGSAWSTALPLLLVALIATLGGTAVTLLVQNALLAPVLESSRALTSFLSDRTLPALPTDCGDEAGLLMRNTQECVTELAALIELKNDLLATLAHDARSPLTSIQLASQLGRSGLGSSGLEREAHEMFALIDTAAARQLQLMNAMLVTALSDSGRLDVKLRPVRLDELVKKVGDLFAIQAAEKGVAFVIETNSVPMLQLDASKTEQVLANLISNAIKFTPRGGTVRVGTISEGEEVGFAVSDSGIGIPEDLRGRLFVRDAGIRREGTRLETGTGLGLWICRTFTELQGGRIRLAETGSAAGTRFEVRFTSSMEAVS